MHTRFLTIVIGIFLCAQLPAQTAVDSVKITIDRMFTAMRQSDPAMLQSCFTDSAVLQTIAKNTAGETRVRSESVAEFMASVASLEKGSADERIVFDIVKVDANLAIAWTPYQFYFKGNFSHCGVNSFQLVRMKNGWKIQYIIDTRRKQGCQ